MSAPLTLSSDAVGLEVGPIEHAIDARWLMAYAAGLGETDPGFYDTRAPGGPEAHPLFPVCYEWPLARQLRERLVSAELELRSVHAQHHLAIHRPPRAGDMLSTRARVLAIVRRKPGALMVVRYETRDAGGEPVTTTEYGSLYRGVAVDGPDRHPPGWAPDLPAASLDLPAVASVPVPATLAHVYTECARIWNPIHTDPAVAERVGLPGIILHGTATLALSVTRALAALGRDRRATGRIGCRFTGMVLMPSTLTLRARLLERDTIRFETLGPDGTPVVSRGLIELSSEGASTAPSEASPAGPDRAGQAGARKAETH
jgi:acyl dehydratase